MTDWAQQRQSPAHQSMNDSSFSGWLLDPMASQRLSTAPLTPSMTILIGPEAGWTDEEEQRAKQAGFIGVQAGPRILRTETAALAVLAAIATRSQEF
jgi:16S rRNA (uracil1498-N3)-methyltransferase